MAIMANGIGSGLDINGLVGQLMSLEQRPLRALNTKEVSFQAKLSAFGQMKGALSALQTAAKGLKDAAKFAGTKATVGADAGFTASSSTSAAVGNYSVEVLQLAKVQRIATSASGTEFSPGSGAGTLTIAFGTVDAGPPAAFKTDPDAPREATLEFAGGTIEDLRNAINGDKALGVTANIVFNGTTKQLVLTGTGTGADKAFSLSGAGSLADLTFDPSTAGTPASPVYSLQNAQDARLRVDGIDITRGTNTITEVVEGVTLTLTKELGPTASLTVASDRTPARSAIDAFVKAYNDATNTLRTLTNYNSETKQAAVLTGDATARGIQSQLRELVGGIFSGLGNTSRLADIGLSFQRDGTLTVDSSKLSAKLNEPGSGIAEFFAGAEGKKGFGELVATRLDAFLGADGLLDGRTKGINSSIKALDKQRAALAVRLEAIEKRYRTQFTSLDSMVSSMTQTSNYLSQQLANLAKLGQG